MRASEEPTGPASEHWSLDLIGRFATRSGVRMFREDRAGFSFETGQRPGCFVCTPGLRVFYGEWLRRGGIRRRAARHVGLGRDDG